MSLSPQDPLESFRAAIEATGSAEPERKPGPWLPMLTATFALVTGLYLAIVPWTDGWTLNFWQEYTPSLEWLWHEPSFRGAVSGLGVANLMIAFQESLRAFRRIPK